MHNNIFVSSQFETWMECKSKYYYKYIKKLRLPETQNNFELGRNVHALANYHLRGLDVSLLENMLDEETAKHWYAIKNHNILRNNLLCTEWEFNSIIGNTNQWFNGRIDAVFYNPEEQKYIIVDWKTGQNVPQNPEDSFQAKIYLYAFFKAQKDLGISLEHDNLIFQHIKTPDCSKIESIKYSSKKEKSYETNFLQIIDSIKSCDFKKLTPEHKSPKCKYCPYVDICRNKS